MDLLLDYLTPTAAAIATISGFAAFVVNTYWREHKVAKAILIILAFIAAMGAIGASFYDRHQTIVAREAEAQRVNAEAQRRKEIRDQLSRFIAEGAQLMVLCGDTSKPIPDQAVDKWGKRIEDYVRSKLGETDVLRMRNPLNPMPTFTIANDKDRTVLFEVVYGVNAHLEQFIRELS